MNIAKRLRLKTLGIATALIAYLLFAAAVAYSQDKGTDQSKSDKSATDVRILIEGKTVEQKKKEEVPKQSTARIILATEPSTAPKKEEQKQSVANQPKVVDPQQRLAKPIRPSSIPRQMTTYPQVSANQAELKSAKNATTRMVPQVSPKVENAKMVNPPVIRSSQLMPVKVAKHQQPEKRSGQSQKPKQTIRISDLPTVSPSASNQSGTQSTGHAIYYPSTSDKYPVMRVNGALLPVETANKNQQEKDAKDKFPNRDQFNLQNQQMPSPLKFPGQDKGDGKERPMDPRLRELLSSGEFLHDGGDRNLKVVVGSDWSVQGLDSQDTIGHFDTLKGDRVVVPSNRVSIYAPRFSAVQKIDGLISANNIEHMAATDDTTMTFRSGSFDFASNAKSHQATIRNIGSKAASEMKDRTRGLTVDNTTSSASTGNSISSVKIHNFLLTGRLENSEKAFLATAMQSAIAWSSDMEVKIVVKNDGLRALHDVKAANETITVDPIGKKSKLRVVKMADKKTAKPGDEIVFLIRFDNVGEEIIGNVTVIDNLTTRLEYVEGSASCSVKADLITSQNDADSTQLRWEIVDPLKIGTGGVIKFKCRVR